ncbi:MAG: hypothetical protein JWN04_2187 [Myxococcaceae bacterium]|nr:hypothetical protein [Myxococcaceae bacterium]
MRTVWLFLLIAVAQLAHIEPASAQLRPRTARVWIDTDLVSVGTVTTDPSGPGEKQRTTTVGVGPNQLAGSRSPIATTPLGIGAAYVLEPEWMVGLRAGFGYNWYSSGPEQRVIAVSAIPELTYVPTGDDDTKLFIKAGPLIQYDRNKLRDGKQNVLIGGFSAGLGALQFVGESGSFDVGAFFEGRFGDLKPDLDQGGNSKVNVRDLRGVLRVSVSLWSKRGPNEEEEGREAERRVEQQSAPAPAYTPPPSVMPAAPDYPPATNTPPPPPASSGTPLPAPGPAMDPSPNAAPLTPVPPTTTTDTPGVLR